VCASRPGSPRCPLRDRTGDPASRGGSPVRICLMIEGQEGVGWDQWMAVAQACEELGFDALFRSDHYAGIPDGGRGALDAWTTLAAIGARTERLRLGTLVSPATFRHPSVLAKSVV